MKAEDIVWKLSLVEILCWKSWTCTNLNWPCLITANRMISCCSCGSAKNAWRIRRFRSQCKSPVSTYFITFGATMSVWYFVWWGGKYYHGTFKAGNFGFRNVFFPVNELSRQNRAMRCRTRKLRGLKVGHYRLIVCLIVMRISLPSLEKMQVIRLMWRNLTKYFWTVCQMGEVSKRICKVLIVKYYLKNMSTFLNTW